MARPALFDAHPELAERIPFFPLGQFPTAVERVRGLLPPAVELWVKRDDRSGVEYGGNKVRKLEFLLGEARTRGAKRLVTVGGIGSHHVLATTIYGRRAGFAVEAVIFPQPVTEHVREQLRVDLAAGAELSVARGYASVPFRLLFRRLQSGTYYIGAGGSSPTGTLGYVSAAYELRAQIERGELPKPDVVYVALGSCGTLAGLLAGLPALGSKVELVGVRVVDRVVANEAATRALAKKTLARLGGAREALSGLGPAPALRIEHGFFGGAYGRTTPEADAAVREAREAGLLLEPTYTGKTMAALLADARAGRLDGKRVLYWHTYSSADLSLLAGRAPPYDAWPAALRRLV